MKGFKNCTSCGIQFKNRTGSCCSSRCAFVLLEWRNSKRLNLVEAASTMKVEVGDSFFDKYEVVRIVRNEFLDVYELLIKLQEVELNKLDEKILIKWDGSH